ncbi:MAG: hypothetical protein AABY90_04050, partial [Nitrospirota bacterium]
MKVKAQVQAEAQTEATVREALGLTLTLTLALACFSLFACGRTEAPDASNAATPAVQKGSRKAPSPPTDIQSRI